jgi:hypothetical protein
MDLIAHVGYLQLQSKFRLHCAQANEQQECWLSPFFARQVGATKTGGGYKSMTIHKSDSDAFVSKHNGFRRLESAPLGSGMMMGLAGLVRHAPWLLATTYSTDSTLH